MNSVRERAKAVCDELLRDGADLSSGGDVPSGVVRHVLRAFADRGFLNADLVDANTGVIAADHLRRVATAAEVFSSRSFAITSIYMVNAVLVASCIALLGSAAQKQALLARLRAGKCAAAFAMTEPDAGSDIASLQTTAVPSEGGFRVTGEKIYTTGASTADLILVLARVAGMGKRDLTFFLVDPSAGGVSIEELAPIAATVHKPCCVHFDRVHVSGGAVLGEAAGIGRAWGGLRVTGSLERIAVSAIALGLAGAIVDRSVEFAKSRRQFGQAIAGFQSIEHALVEMRTTQTAMRLFTDNAVSKFGSDEEAESVSMAKYFCAEQLQQLARRGMAILGGRAFFEMEEMARYFREAPFSMYAGGTSEIQKRIIARAMGLGE